MTPDHELHHIENGPDPAESPEGVGLVTFDVDCDGNAQQVHDRALEVMGVVVRQYARPWWPAIEEWETILPKWFVEACAPEDEETESEEWLAWWRTLPREEQSRVEAETRWSLADWIYWFQPENRHWYWWDALVDSPDAMRVAVQVDAWPFPWAALRWLLKAAGAKAVTSDEED
jgi:hypothetical protein